MSDMLAKNHTFAVCFTRKDEIGDKDIIRFAGSCYCSHALSCLYISPRLCHHRQRSSFHKPNYTNAL